MTEKEESFLKVCVLIAMIAILIVMACRIGNKLEINGESVEVYAETIEAAVPTEVPVAFTATPIADVPVYIQTIDVECISEDDEQFPTRDEIYCLARLVHGEASICSDLVKSQVAWCVLNRVDSESYPNTIREVCSQSGQFAGWDRDCSSEPSEDERKLVYDIIYAWKNGNECARTLPQDYLFFMGDGETNFFTKIFYGDLKKAKKYAWKGEE